MLFRSVVRTEGELDPKTRMINVIAQVKNPYEQQGSRPPLAVGLFVEAEIIGHRVDDIFVLPRSALQANSQVYMIDQNNRLSFHDVNVLRHVREEVYISSGIRNGDTICISTVSNAVEGMEVRPVTETLASS